MSTIGAQGGRAVTPPFQEGDVVYDEEDPTKLGLITAVHARSVVVVFENGVRSGGPGLLIVLRLREPRVRLDVPRGALGNRWWNRSQSIRAALRRAGVRS